MITLKSYVAGAWKAGSGEGRILRDATTGEPVATCSSEGIDFAAAASYGRERGGPALRAMTFPERAALLKKAAAALNEHTAELYEIAATYGATRADARMDVDGGIATLGFYASLGTKSLPDAPFLVDGEPARLSKGGAFIGRHVLVPREGLHVQINAYNFPCWGMLEKLAPSLLAGMPNLVKPATPSAWLAFRVVEILVGAEILPEGALQLVCGSVGDLFDHLTGQDVISFTGSASTGQRIRSHPNVVRQAVRVNVEADSLNAIVLGPDVEPGTETFDFFLKEVVAEMIGKAGQKCTAIRRVLVPRKRESAVIDELGRRLAAVVIGDPRDEKVQMGPLVDRDAVEAARRGIETLQQEATIVYGDPNRTEFEGVDGEKGAFMEPILLYANEPERARLIHDVEVFGPVATIVGYRDVDDAIALARRGGGSLVASVYTEDDELATRLAFALAPHHGRLLLLDARSAAESTGHGVVMPHLVHGGPGRAGGGEELGGLRSLDHFLQRTALQGHPDRLERIVAPAVGGKEPPEAGR